MTPHISIIVPVYNVAAYIGACLTSLQDQTYTDFEAIVIDDGSEDDSRAVIEQTIAQDPRFVLIRQENRGLSAARNAGLEKAKGAVIGFLDGDDRFAPTFLAEMVAALENSTAGWVACALSNMYENGETDTHSARHDTPELGKEPTQLFALDTWDQVIAHYPSAWNKLYRQSLISGLRFDEGTWFEDHAFFLQVAARTDSLLYLAKPLYWQTRGRIGQITTTDSDRIFEQLSVLDRVAPLLTGSTKPGGVAALGTLGHRLIHERSMALRDPKRRARFVTAARDWLRTHALPTTAPDNLPRLWSAELAGPLPLSVIIPWDGQDKPLTDSLTSLKAQNWNAFDVIIATDDTQHRDQATHHLENAGLVGQALVSATPGAGAARNTALSAATGTLVVFLDAGDHLRPDTLARWTDALLSAQADFGQSQFRVGRQGDIHCGLHDASWLERLETGSEKGSNLSFLPQNPDLALVLHCHPSARIFRRAFLEENHLRFGTGPLSDWSIGIGAALLADRAVYFDWPGVESSEDAGCRRIWRAPVKPRHLMQALHQARSGWPPRAQSALPADWRRRLLSRAVWEKWHFSSMTPCQRRFFDLGVRWIARRNGLRHMQGPLDPYISDEVRHMIGVQDI